jgi:hypothetical protein
MDKFATHTIKVSFKRDSEEYREIERVASKLGIGVDRAVEILVVMGLSGHIKETLPYLEKMGERGEWIE